MLPDQKVEMTWTSGNKTKYQSLGYVYTKMGNTFLINVSHLSKNSHKYVTVFCDFCGAEIKKIYQAYNREKEKSVTEGDCCFNCVSKKSQLTLEKLYGVSNMQYIPGTKEAARRTCLQKYGCEHHLSSEKVKQTRENNNMRKYGVKNPSQLDSVKQKKKETTYKHFHVENPFQSEMIINKIKKHNLETYNVEWTGQRQDVKNKIAYSLYKNQSQKTSNQQRYISYLLNGELNYSVDGCNLDVLLDTKNLIFIEYQGSGHELNVKFGRYTQKEFDEKEKRRSYYLYHQSYKQIEIISRKDYLPSDDTILDMITFAKEYILQEHHSWIKFDIDNKTIISSQFRYYNVDFGKLRKIKKSDLQAS